MAAPTIPILDCPAPKLRPGFQGIRRVAVLDGEAKLSVVFQTALTAQQLSYLLNIRSYTLTGGQRLFPRIVNATPDPSTPTERVLLTLDTEGDFSIYTLTVSGPDIDPIFGSRKFRFRLDCDDRFDCRSDPPAVSPEPDLAVVIDYLAKDYSSFRQALIDFIPTRLPAWTERSPADIGIMVMELFAYTADTLSYMQDRVASEAFLTSATQRRSVAGHLALIGYEMDQGASAHTWMHFDVSTDVNLSADSRIQVSNSPRSSSEPVLIFETSTAARFKPAHNSMPLFKFGNVDCCLPQSSLSAALAGTFERLRAGDYLLFDSGKGQRDVVRLISKPELSTSGDPFTVIRWSEETPLHFEYCATSTVVRGNLVLATHGETVTDGPRSLAAEQRLPRIRMRLRQSPLAYLDAATLALTKNRWQPKAEVSFTSRTQQSFSTLSLSVDGVPWQEQTTLLESGPNDTAYRVEVDDAGEASVIFGDGTFGLTPPQTATVTATYRTGGGTAGNLGAETLIELRKPIAGVIAVTNPLPAVGGRNLESRQHARRVGPPTFQKPIVAVTANDFQVAAQQFRDLAGQLRIQRANAKFRWTGSWLTVTVAVDPRGTETLDGNLKKPLLEYLDTRRLAGYDLEVTRAILVPIELGMEFCVKPGFLAADVQQALLQVLSSGDLPNQGKGFFHPDNFTFGDSVFVSRLYAAAMTVPGIESAQITRLARLHAARPDSETTLNLQRGFLEVGADQIVRLDNDRNFPENGTLLVRSTGTAQ